MINEGHQLLVNQKQCNHRLCWATSRLAQVAGRGVHQGLIRVHQGLIKVHQGLIRVHQSLIRVPQGLTRVSERSADPTESTKVHQGLIRVHQVLT